MHYLGICAIIRDEAPFLREWVAYHMSLGAEAFYLYDNESKIPVRQTLAAYVDRLTPARMVIHDAPGAKLQMITYGHCVAAYGTRCRWLAFVDLDECIAPLRHDSIPAMLEEFEPYAGLALNWKIFGTNGHTRRPGDGQIEHFTMALGPGYVNNGHVKSILNPAAVAYFPSPHHAAIREGAGVTVRTDHKPVSGPFAAPPLWDKGQVNHYYFRAKQDYYAKLRKPRPDLKPVRDIPEKVAPPTGDHEDLSAFRFLARVRRTMQETEEGPES